jgi:hypothetical protein
MHARSRLTIYAIIMALAIILSGCLGLGQKTPVPPTIDPQYTQAAETLAAAMTGEAPVVAETQAVVSAPTSLAEALPSFTATQPALPDTSTPVPTETLPPTSTPMPTEPPPPTETPTSAATATPTATATPAWKMVFEDDLKSGIWLSAKSDDFRLQYTGGGYMITNRVKEDIAYSVRQDSYYDMQIEVRAHRTEGPLDGYYGIICNFQNGTNYYILAVGVDGWYGIGLKKTGQIRFLKEGVDQTGAIHTGSSENLLRAECAQGVLTLWVNGIQLASVKDRTFTSGQIGLGVGNRKVTGTVAIFQDFKLFSLLQP